jgi:hypothetical protein
MSFDYIRRYYGVPAKKGMRVAWDCKAGTRLGTITSATNYVHIRFDDCKAKFSVPLHPMEEGLRYLSAQADASAPETKVAGTV